MWKQARAFMCTGRAGRRRRLRYRAIRALWLYRFCLALHGGIPRPADERCRHLRASRKANHAQRDAALRLLPLGGTLQHPTYLSSARGGPPRAFSLPSPGGSQHHRRDAVCALGARGSQPLISFWRQTRLARELLAGDKQARGGCGAKNRRKCRLNARSRCYS